MKKILVAFALAAVASTASATIAGSSHDLTTKAGATLGSCQYCHAPHLWTVSNLGTGIAPLWNKNQTAALTAYTSATLKGVATPGMISRACLSCHDGASDLGAVVNGIVGNIGAIAAVANIGTDLTNDHPVGRPEPAGDATFVQTPAAPIALFAGNVECASCHEPHGAYGQPKFLRVAITGLCAACHTK
ncbi:MAG TPA: cytochrome c3 family protein [Anaeromyxobacteraceae bacterium]|nr:cytochrome c3 family protein [Anaeromyxobacteraceae bacterium]